MNSSIQQIAHLEWANYAATLPVAQVTPGFEILLADDVILTSNLLLPSSDVTHACLLKATPETIEALIERIIHYFKAKALPVTIFISPACTPADLVERLSRRGFEKDEGEEAWLIWPHLSQTVIPPLRPRVKVRRVSLEDVSAFVEATILAFEIPAELKPLMIQLTESSVNLPGIYHFLALIDDQPVGTCSLMCYKNVGVVGGVGVIPASRRSGAVTNLMLTAGREAQVRQIETLVLQTASAMPLERLLRLSGFKKLFTRISYTFHEPSGKD
jgi:hypothetical protein